MQANKPEIPTVYVVAKDKLTGKSKTLTVYNATPQQVIELLSRDLSERSERKARAAS